MPFFQPPLRLDDFQRASSAFPVASTSAARLPDSPSPNKKRRVGSVPPSLATGQRGHGSAQSKATSQSPAPRPQAASRKSASDAARRSEINARYAELSRDEARLQATLRLQDAWEDIQRRHSNLAVVSDSGEQRGRNNSGAGTEQRKKRYRHRPGRTRALPVEEDDIIDLSTLDFVQDRGVLRSSKAGGFAIGRYGNGRDGGDILVGLDTGGGGAKGGAASSAGDTHGSAGDEDDPTDNDEDEDEDEWADYTDSDAPSCSSDDELGEDDDLLPPPSLLFREQRRKEAERLREMREFQEHEAKARGGELVARAQQLDEVVVLRGGNVQLPAPIGPPQSAPRRRLPPSLSTDDDDDDDLALSPLRARSVAPGAPTTPTRLSKAASQPPSSTATLRRSVSDIRLDSPAATTPARTPPRRASTPVSSSPLREVITIASPTPPPPPLPAKAAAGRTVSSRNARPKSPSPELFAPPEASSSARVVARYSPELSAPVPVPYQQATPTPTPPPVRTSSARKPPTVPAQAAPTKPSARKIRHSSFELIIDVKPPRSRQPPLPATMKRSTGPKKVVLASSASMPNLPATAREVAPDLAAAKPAPLVDDEAQAPRRVGGLSTPPLSKRSTVSRRSPSQSPPKARAPSTASPARARITATPSVILPAPPISASVRRTRGEDDSDEDELMLSSPIKPTEPHRRHSSHAAWLLELVVSVSTTCHLLALVSYLLSPAHFLILAYRIVLQVQFTLPRRVHANRSLRFFVALWGIQALVAIGLHAITGSQGTKGPRGYVQRGLVLDFVVFTPSTLHLVALDVLLAFLQLVTIVLAFGATVPTDLDATTSTESSRDYSSLLGIDDDYEDEAEGRDPFNASGSEFSRSRSGYSALADVEEDGARPSVFNMEMDDLGVGKSRSLVDQIQWSAHTSPHTPGTSSKYSSLASDPALRLRVPVPLIASVRLDTIWREVRKSASQDRAEREEGGLRGLEEGRGPS
ncbi:hypothetical protein B0A53_01664 [Rhodotorula sp. CCFEE 5036]|nr:hypothetical protein B0A53_01664 [Rhodotorula sp. CCFEE 5036]